MSCRDGYAPNLGPLSNPGQTDMGRAAHYLQRVLTAATPAGLPAWALLRRPDIRRYLMEAWWDVEAAVDACDLEAFVAAVERATRLSQRAARIYAREQGRIAKVDIRPWPGLVLLRQRQDTVIPLGRNDRAELTLSGPAAFPAPALPQGGNQTNGPDEVRA